MKQTLIIKREHKKEKLVVLQERIVVEKVNKELVKHQRSNEKD
jgi:hypothetical protein